MNNRSFIRSSPLHVVHILKYPIALQRERRDHELKLRRYAGTTCTIHEAVIECTAYVHIGMRRQKCTQICDLLHSLPSICTTIPYTSVAQPIGACEHRVEYYTRYKLRAPSRKSLQGPDRLRLEYSNDGRPKLTHVARRKLYIGCRKGGVVWSVALLETCCAKLQKNSKCRSYLRYRRRHETLLSW